jgi:hypothetical protein
MVTFTSTPKQATPGWTKLLVYIPYAVFTGSRFRMYPVRYIMMVMIDAPVKIKNADKFDIKIAPEYLTVRKEHPLWPVLGWYTIGWVWYWIFPGIEWKH